MAEWTDRKYVDGNDRLAGSIGSIWAFRVDYGLEKASLLGRLLIHGSLCWVVTLITSRLLYRAEIGVLVRETLPRFVIVYAVVWFIIILWERRTVKQLNKRLREE